MVGYSRTNYTLCGAMQRLYHNLVQTLNFLIFSTWDEFCRGTSIGLHRPGEIVAEDTSFVSYSLVCLIVILALK